MGESRATKGERSHEGTEKGKFDERRPIATQIRSGRGSARRHPYHWPRRRTTAAKRTDYGLQGAHLRVLQPVGGPPTEIGIYGDGGEPGRPPADQGAVPRAG